MAFHKDGMNMHLLTKKVVCALAIVAGCATCPAHAEIQIDCGMFKKNADGSWSPTSEISLSSDGMSLSADRGTKFISGAHFGRLDLYAIIERNCGQH
jgi:hypothetical protein